MMISQSVIVPFVFGRTHSHHLRNMVQLLRWAGAELNSTLRSDGGISMLDAARSLQRSCLGKTATDVADCLIVLGG